MVLETKLTEIQGRLAPEHFPNEAAVSQGIVLPVLRELNWDTDNPMVVRPEYTAGRGRVDFALCEQSGSPKVFIEVKGLGGETEDAVEQVMQYAFRAGVRIVVLTDGGTWSVYLPAEEGSYEERRVFKLDLSEHSPQKSSEVLQRYLEESRVVSDDALKSALRDLGDRKRLEKARRAVPSAWRDIFEPSEPDESLNLLVDVLADRVESKVGVRPDDNDVVNFLRSLQRQEGQVSAMPPSGAGERRQPVQRRVRRASAPPMPPVPMLKTSAVTQPESGRQVSAPLSSGASGGGRSGVLVILGKSFPCKNHTDAMVIVFKELERRKPGFCQRFYNDPRNRRRTSRIIAQDASELYGSTYRENRHKRIDSNWVISTDYVRQKKKEIIQLAAEVAGLKFGRDIIITLNNGGQSKSQSPLQNPDTVFQVGSVSRKFLTGGIRQQIFNLINEGKEVTLRTILNTIPKDKAVAALKEMVKHKIVAIK